MAQTAPIYAMTLPLFGKCRLLPHDLGETPQGMAVYLEYESKPGTLTSALYTDGQFRTRNLKPVTEPLVRWYSVEREDGRPIF